MNLAELREQPRPTTFKVGLPFLGELFQYSTTPGELPMGVQITITGEPGVGKTRFGLQLLNAIALANPHLATEVWSFELDAPQLADLTEALDVSAISNFETGDTPKGGHDVNYRRQTFQHGTVYLVDSADWWARKAFRHQWPTDEMAIQLDTAQRGQIPVLMIHHQTKDQRSLSGAVSFRQISDIIIELKKTGERDVTLTTKRKNRYCGKRSSVKLVHTGEGLKLAPPTGYEAFAMIVSKWFQG